MCAGNDDAMNAVAKFRNKDLFQFFYAADNLDSAKWDQRSLGNDDRLSEKEKIIYLPLDKISPNRAQPRRRFNTEELQELADDLFQGCPIEKGDVFFDDDWDSKYCHGRR